MEDWTPPKNWEELAALLFVALLKAVHYLWRRRQGHSRLDSLRPWGPKRKDPTDGNERND